MRSSLSPRRLFRRFRLRWVLLFVVACVVWLVAVLTEPAPAELAFGSPPATDSALAAERPPYPPAGRAVASSPEAASRFFRKLATAVRAGVETGHVQLSISEAEATSALDAGAQLVEIREIMSTLSPEELEELDTPEEIRRALDDAHDREPPTGLRGRVRYALNPRLRFREAQVRFRSDGRVLVSGYALAWSRRVPMSMEAVPTLEDGQLRMEFHKTRLGRIRVPNWVLSGPAKLLTLVLGLGKDYASLDGLRVGDGRLTLSGRVRMPTRQ